MAAAIAVLGCKSKPRPDDAGVYKRVEPGDRGRAPTWQISVQTVRYPSPATKIRPLVVDGHVVAASRAIGTAAARIGDGHVVWRTPHNALALVPADANHVETTDMCAVTDDCTGVRAVKRRVSDGVVTAVLPWSEKLGAATSYLVDHESGRLTFLDAASRLLQPPSIEVCGRVASGVPSDVQVIAVGSDVIVGTSLEVARFASTQCTELREPVWRHKRRMPLLAGPLARVPNGSKLLTVDWEKLDVIDARDGSVQSIAGEYQFCPSCILEVGGAMVAVRRGESGLEVVELRAVSTAAPTVVRRVAIPGRSVFDAVAFLDGVAFAVPTGHTHTILFVQGDKVRWMWELPTPEIARSSPPRLASGAAGLVAFYDERELAFWASAEAAPTVEKRDGPTP